MFSATPFTSAARSRRSRAGFPTPTSSRAKVNNWSVSRVSRSHSSRMLPSNCWGSVTPEAVRELLRRTNVDVHAVAVDENIFTRAGPRLADAAASLNRILDQWEASH